MVGWLAWLLIFVVSVGLSTQIRPPNCPPFQFGSFSISAVSERRRFTAKAQLRGLSLPFWPSFSAILPARSFRTTSIRCESSTSRAFSTLLAFLLCHFSCPKILSILGSLVFARDFWARVLNLGIKVWGFFACDLFGERFDWWGWFDRSSPPEVAFSWGPSVGGEGVRTEQSLPNVQKTIGGSCRNIRR